MSVDFESLTVRDLTRDFGRRRVLRDVAFACRAGEVVGVLGPNGAGKSTLLAVLSTLLTPSSGLVEYGAHTPREAGAALRRRIGWLGHDLQLYPELTARENLSFFARLTGTPLSHVGPALAGARLEDRADEPIARFSRGMRQRLALERALLHRPRLVLLDEPFTGLDQPSAAALRTRITALAGQGCLVLLATHDLTFADGMLTRAVVIRDGRLVPAGDGAGWRQAYQAVLGRES